MMFRLGLGGLGAIVGLILWFAILATHFFVGPAAVEAPTTRRLHEVVSKPVWETGITPDGRTYSILTMVPEQRTSEHRTWPTGFEVNPWADLAGHLGRSGELGQVMTLIATADKDAVRAELINSLLPHLRNYAQLETQQIWSKQPPPVLSDKELKTKAEGLGEFLEQQSVEVRDAAPEPADAPKPADATEEFHAVQASTRRADADSTITLNQFKMEVAEHFLKRLNGLIDEIGKLTPPSLRADIYATTANELFEQRLTEKASEIVRRLDGTVRLADKNLWAWASPAIYAILGFVIAKMSSPLLEAMGSRIGYGIAHAAGANKVGDLLDEEQEKESSA